MTGLKRFGRITALRGGRWQVACVALLACMAVTTSAARAQPLADKVPADAMLYIGWQGYDTKSPGFAGSHFEAVLKAAEFQKFVDVTVPQILDKVAQKDQRAAGIIAVAVPVLKPMFRHPTTIWLGKPDIAVGGNKPPVIRAGIICQAGPDGEAMMQSLQALLEQAGPQANEQIKLVKTADSVIVSMNYAEGDMPPAGQSLAQSASFKAVTPHAVPNASFIVYADVEQLVTVVDQAVDTYAQGEPKEVWPKMREAIGLQGVKHFIWTSGFDGKEWMDHMFLHAPGPRTGLVALGEAKPLSDGVLKVVPVTATAAGAFRFDAGKVFAGIRAAVAKVDPRAGQRMDDELAKASKSIGMDIEKDVIGVFGDEWIYYIDPTVGGRGGLGFVLINKLADPAQAEQSLVKLGQLMEDELAKAMRMPEMKVKMFTTKSGETTIHYVGTPLISPAWAVRNGYLVVGMFPQVVAGALDQFGSDKSILDNPAYQQVRARLNVADATGVGFADLQKTAPDGYTTWLMISRLTGFAEMFGVDSPAMILPPLNRLMPHLTPAGSVLWVDKDGYHAKNLTPFPGATLLAQDPLAGGAMFLPAMMAGAMNARQSRPMFEDGAPPPRLAPEPVAPPPGLPPQAP